MKRGNESTGRDGEASGGRDGCLVVLQKRPADMVRQLREAQNDIDGMYDGQCAGGARERQPALRGEHQVT